MSIIGRANLWDFGLTGCSLNRQASPRLFSHRVPWIISHRVPWIRRATSSYAIAKTSGSDALDREAQELLKRAEPLPAIPVAFGRDTLDLVVPVEFFLH